MTNPIQPSITLFSMVFWAISLQAFGKLNKPANMETNKKEAYEKRWSMVDSLDQKGLPKSALKEVDYIYTKAKSESNTGEFIKAVLHKLKYTSYTEEDAFVVSLFDLEKEANAAVFPAKQILHSMLAEMYWTYYQQNRYRFMDRSVAVDFDNKDIRTWDLKNVVENVEKHYAASLEETQMLKGAKIDSFQTILQNEYNTKNLRPTLFEFLAHRAIDFYMSSESDLAKPADYFVINDDAYFSPVGNFVNYPFKTNDLLNFKYLGMQLLQDVLKFRLQENLNKDNGSKVDNIDKKNTDENNLESLVDADLKRLALVLQQSVDPEKDIKYLHALENMEIKYKKNKVSAQVSYKIAEYWHGQGQKYNPLQTDAHKWDTKKAYDICKETTKAFPGSEGAINCKSLICTIEAKQIQLTFEKVNIPNVAFKGLVNYTNVDKLYFRIIRTNRDEFNKIFDKKTYYYDDDYKRKVIEYYTKKKPEVQFETTLPDDGDFQGHSAEVKIPALGLGEYIVLAGTNAALSFDGNAVAFDFVTHSNISYFHRTLFKSGETEFFVMERNTGKPIVEAKAQVWHSVYNNKKGIYEKIKGETKTTDANGYFKIMPLSENQYSNGFDVEFSYLEDRFSTQNVDDRENYYNTTFHQSRPNNWEGDPEHTRTFYFTDRAIYRPGQTIYFKGIMLETDGKKKNELVKNYPVNVSLYDVNRQLVATLSLKTNEFGSFNGSFTAPSSGLNGNMTIEDGYGSTSVSVEEYKRPKFEVEIPNIKGAFRLGDEIKVTGHAKAYSGANIDGASVKYRVVRDADFPYWWFYRWGYYPNSPQIELLNGTAKTDEKGEFDILFKALPDLAVTKDSKPTFRFTVYADVTDQNGETHSTEKTISIGYVALKLSTNTPTFVDKNKPTVWDITSTNLNNEFEPVQGKITIHKLKDLGRALKQRPWSRPDKFTMNKDEFQTSFPFDEYADENNRTSWERSGKTLDQAFDTKTNKKLVLDKIKDWKTGSYVVEILAKDSYGEEVKEIAYFTVIDPKDKEVPFAQIDWFKPIKPMGEPGEKAEILVGTSVKTYVLYEIEKEKETLSRQWIKLDNEQKLLEIPLTEDYRGNIGIHYTFVHQNKLYVHNETIVVPFTNKMLDISFETFRDKLLPGQKEEWKLRIKGKNGDKVAAEMVASLYDASLDAFRANSFYFSIYNPTSVANGWTSSKGFENTEANLFSNDWNKFESAYYKRYFELNWFDYNPYYFQRYHRHFKNGRAREGASMPMKAMSAVAMDRSESEESNIDEVVAVGYGAQKKKEAPGGPPLAESDQELSRTAPKKKEEAPIKARTNFNETAFFYPSLQTDANGDLLIAFTIPEALTRWKMLGFAHTQDLKFGFATNALVTQKDLMITSSAPRFFREGDKIVFTSKVTNLSDKELVGISELLLFDAISMQPIDLKLGNVSKSKPFTVKAGQSTGLSWELSIPETVQAVTYRVTAKSGNFSDGEEMTVPVLTNRMMVTESMPLPIRSKQSKTFSLDKLVNNKSTTLRNHKLTLEFTSNPAWYAVQALPYLMEFPYECAEQTFSRFYANSIASHIANSSPKIKKVFDSWKSEGSEALVSNLEKNQELKALLLEETPWVMDAKGESERKKRVALLFDLNKMANELERAITKLGKMQNHNGGWPWFDGMPESWYITQHIVTGLGHLDRLGVKNVREDPKILAMVRSAVSYIDNQIKKQYEELVRLDKKGLIKLSDNHLGYMEIQYLYARSFFIDVAIPGSSQKAFDYFRGQAKKYWLNRNFYMEGMIALGLHRWGDKETPLSIIRSLREHAISSEEMGMYFKPENGYYWYQAPVETQALLIEVFDEVAKDNKAVDDMKVWLLKNKQTNDWNTTKATTEACYALLLRGTDWLASDQQVEIKVGNIVVDPTKLEGTKTEAGTGYFKTSWNGGDITPEMGKVSLVKKDEGVSWGALYWQYFEQLDKITPHETPLKLSKKLFLEKPSATGPVIVPVDTKTMLVPGDLVKVRIELRVDRDMEYVHMKDQRASSFEPINVLSQYKYQDGLGYYESTRDAATHFFFDYLLKGTYVFEYALRATHIGDFSNGITSIQCMYAPEFGSHSEGVRVKIGGN